ncbi:MAG: bifunctional precorrin-2 dehydrogenase/sirohydrochlorin ferrochelatase [Ignavibacteriaceae bacterium]|jgi:precorrin-2 dehydrogenase/sirohydrochlorin ferrochelatase
MNENKNSIYFPLLLNIKNYPCLVVGGSTVALRKVTSLLNFRIKSTVLAPKICQPLLELHRKRKIKVIKKVYSKEYLNNFKIVFCATDNPKINKMVRKDCTGKNILLNVADIPELCDFILPAIVKRGDLTISVSSQGIAPFYVAELRKKLDHIFPSYYENIIELAGEFRKLLLSDKKYKSPQVREKAFKNFFMIDWKKVLANEGKKKAKEYIHSILEDLKQKG